MYKDDPDAALVKMGMDITGDGQPDLVISEWLGGANCCLIFHIFEIGPTFKKLGTIDAEFGDSGPHFIHPDKDSKNTGLAIQIHDWTFANWNTDFADSPAPKVILRFSDNAYRIAPDLMRAPAPQCQRPGSARRRGREVRAERQGRRVASRRSLAAAMGNDARSDLQRPRGWRLEVPRRRVAVESPRQGCLRARLPRSTRQESLLARSQDDEFREASRWQD